MRIIFLGILLAFCYWIPFAYKRANLTLRITKCRIEWPKVAAWEVEVPSEKKALEQSYSYFSKGRQAYVFLSEDGNYILKLFRFDQCTLPKIKKKRRETPFPANVPRTFNSCKLIYDQMKEESGLVYIHLNPKRLAVPHIVVKDRIGLKHKIDPERDRFVIQRKGELLLPALKKGENVAPLVESYFALIHRFCELGIANEDQTMSKNFGILDGKVFPIDTGCFYENADYAKKDVENFTRRMNRWLEKNGLTQVCKSGP